MPKVLKPVPFFEFRCKVECLNGHYYDFKLMSSFEPESVYSVCPRCKKFTNGVVVDCELIRNV